MSHPCFIVINGNRYRWKDILELRRSQIAVFHATQARQMALFEALLEDCRPSEARTASGRYLQPTLFEIGA